MVLIIIVLSIESAKKKPYFFLKKADLNEKVDHYKIQFFYHMKIMNKEIMFGKRNLQYEKKSNFDRHCRDC